MNDEMIKLKQTVIEDMMSYMNSGVEEDEPDFDAGYTQNQVNRCSEIIDTFLAALEKVPQSERNEFIMEAVKVAVLDLNELNDECDGNLIETDQREQLCELIITAANQAGLVSSEYDITEEWRDW